MTNFEDSAAVDCTAAQPKISAWLDGELNVAEEQAVRAHVEGCVDCMAEADLLRRLDVDMRGAFADRQVAAERIAAAALAALEESQEALAVGDSETAIENDEQLPSPRSEDAKGQSAQANSNWALAATALLGVAIGFGAACLLFAPWNESPRVGVQQPPGDSKPPQPREVKSPKRELPAAARLAIAMGEVQAANPTLVSNPNGSTNEPVTNWSTADPAVFQCPSGGQLRTGNNALAELKTANGCIVRMNAKTQIRVVNDSHVELLAGQIWASAPEGTELRVVVPDKKEGVAASTQKPYLAVCSEAGAWLTARSSDNVFVSSSKGAVRVESPQGVTTLKPGEVATCGAGYSRSAPKVDLSWTHPLLAQKGAQDDELKGLVDKLLVGVGATKASWLNERQLRALGERGVLPLLRFVRSDRSKSNAMRRRQAMRIASDMAPLWVAPDLVALLADEDAEIRMHAAVALKRLTNQQHGRTPQMWKEPVEKCQPAIQRWRNWLDNNRGSYYRPSA